MKMITRTMNTLCTQVFVFFRITFVLILLAGFGDASETIKSSERSPIVTLLDSGGAKIGFTLDQPGMVSAAIYDNGGFLVRELLRGQALEAEEHQISWDGLDRDGEPQPAGDYEVRILRTPGLVAEYVTSLGIRPGSAPYDSWVGNHGGTAAIAADKTGLYASATVTETAPVLIKQSHDGKQRFWTRGRGDVTKGRFQGGAALASDGAGRLYMLQQNGYLQVIDAIEGRRLATWDVLPGDTKRNREESNQIYRHGAEVAAADLAANGKILVLSQRDLDLITWLDTETGEATATLQIKVPGGLAISPDGKVFAISGRKVLEVAPDGVSRTVIEDGLEAPARLAYDPEGQNLLVVEWGDRHQIHRYSLDGKRLATYGREGGRRDGTYVPTDFLQVSAIAADENGGFFIAEQAPAPRRVARLNCDGKVLDEWYGGQPYYAWGAPDPKQPNRVWFNPGSWLTLAEIDPENKTWRVIENYQQAKLGGGLVGAVTGHRGRWHVLYHEDRRYLVSESAPQVLLHEDGDLRAVTVVDNDAKSLAQAIEIADYKGEAKAFRWLDLNGDGQPQSGEFSFAQEQSVPNGSRGVSEKFELLTVVSERDDDDRAYVRVLSTAPEWRDNIPVYPMGEEPGINEIAGDVTVDNPAGTGGIRGVGAFRDSDGNTYSHFNTRDDWHGTTWPTYWGGQSRLVQWDPAGNLRWQVGRHAIHGGLGSSPHTTPPGQIHVGAAIIGEVHDCVVMTDRVEWMGMVWTKDGLYVGNVLDGRVDDGLPDAVYYWWRTPDGKEAIVTSDNATGGAIVEDDKGAVWFFTQGRNCVPTYRIYGWDGWQRMSSRFTIDQEPHHAVCKGSGLKASYFLGIQGSEDKLDSLIEDLSDDVRVPQKEEDIFLFSIRGKPQATQIDPRVWHGSPRRRPGNHEVVDGASGGPTVDWSHGVKPLDADRKVPRIEPFAVRWTGEIEAPLSESFVFSTYQRGGVRLWIDGQQSIFGWNESKARRESPPIELEAGKRYTVQLDFYSTHAHPSCSLNWESFSIDRQRIPQCYLYPETNAEPASLPDARQAIESISADTFDMTNIDGENSGNYTYGLRHRGIGKRGAWLGYQRIDFGSGASKLHALASGHPAGKKTDDVILEFRLGSPDGQKIAEVHMNHDLGVPDDGIELSQKVSGVNDVFIVNATSEGWHFVRLHGFSFE